MRTEVQLVLFSAAALSVNIAFADNTSSNIQLTEVELKATIADRSL